MVDFDDELRKIKDLSGQYKEKIDTEKKTDAVMRRQHDAEGDIVKAKIKNLEDSIQGKSIPFQVNYRTGEIGEIPMFRTEGDIYLVKTVKNGINIQVRAPSGITEESQYMNTDSGILSKITDQMLSEFLNAIREELERRLSKYNHP